MIRAIRPADEVEVMCSRGGIPEFVRGRIVCARVVSISGPWRREGEWWLDSETPANGSLTAAAPSPALAMRAHPLYAPGATGQGEGLQSLREASLTPLPDQGEDARATRARVRVFPLARDYYDVALADGGVYRMFCDLRSQQWFVDGVYD